MTVDELADIRATLWRLLAELREGELDLEVAEQQISALDSLIDVVRAESEVGPGKRQAGEEATEHAEGATRDH